MGTTCGTVIVIDRDARTRDAIGGLAQRLGYAVSACAPGHEVLDDLSDAPVLAVIEVETPSPSGLELLRAVHERFGDEVPVILVSGERTEALDRVAGLLLGADDYVVKPFDDDEMLARMLRSLRRANGHGNGNRNGNGNGHARHADDVPLTTRELEILRLLATGHSQQEIAETLVVSPKTVGTHIQHVLTKLRVHSRAQAVAEAYRLGLVEPDFEAHGLTGPAPLYLVLH
jgi:DNA-binding NarL/FixJ family response regulator